MGKGQSRISSTLLWAFDGGRDDRMGAYHERGGGGPGGRRLPFVVRLGPCCRICCCSCCLVRGRGIGAAGSCSIRLIVGGTLGVGCDGASFRAVEPWPALRMSARMSLTERSFCPVVSLEEDEVRRVGGAIDGGFVYKV